MAVVETHRQLRRICIHARGAEPEAVRILLRIFVNGSPLISGASSGFCGRPSQATSGSQEAEEDGKNIAFVALVRKDFDAPLFTRQRDQAFKRHVRRHRVVRNQGVLPGFSLDRCGVS